MVAYLTLAEFRGLSVMPDADITGLEASAPGWVDNQLAAKSEWLNALLRKRYPVPFAAPVPQVVKSWLARLVTLPCYLRRGVDATDGQFDAIKADAEKAEAEVLEAADGNGGKWELPVVDTGTPANVTRGRPLAYSEASPYVGFSAQARRGRQEDAAGRGRRG